MSRAKQITLWIIVFAPLVYLMGFVDPLAQKLAYHNFADTNCILGLNNFHNVISNIPFVIVALISFSDFKKDKSNYSISWLAFFIGVFLVGPGSAYYHYNPNNFTLVWDRLPMTIGFMGLTSAAFCELYKVKKESPILISLLLLGALSVIYWYVTDDLRPYFWVQLTPITSLLYISLAYKTPGLKPKYLVGAVLFYVAAKVTEKYDLQIFEMISYSGHSIKHFLAAIAVFILAVMKRRDSKQASL